MDSNYIEQHLLIDRYLRGTLENGERDALEERLVWDKTLVDELDLAERLRESLRDAATNREYVAKPRGFDLVAMVTGFLSVPQYAAATSFVFAAMLTAGVLLNPSVNIGGSQGDPAAQTEIVPLLTVRGASVQTVNVDKNAWTVLLVDVMGNHTSYRVTIRKGARARRDAPIHKDARVRRTARARRIARACRIARVRRTARARRIARVRRTARARRIAQARGTVDLRPVDRGLRAATLVRQPRAGRHPHAAPRAGEPSTPATAAGCACAVSAGRWSFAVAYGAITFSGIIVAGTAPSGFGACFCDPRCSLPSPARE